MNLATKLSSTLLNSTVYQWCNDRGQYEQHFLSTIVTISNTHVPSAYFPFTYDSGLSEAIIIIGAVTTLSGSWQFAYGNKCLASMIYSGYVVISSLTQLPCIQSWPYGSSFRNYNKELLILPASLSCDEILLRWHGEQLDLYLFLPFWSKNNLQNGAITRKKVVQPLMTVPLFHCLHQHRGVYPLPPSASFPSKKHQHFYGRQKEIWDREWITLHYTALS